MDPSVFSKSEIRRVKGDREKERETKRKKESLYRNTIYSSCHRDGGRYIISTSYTWRVVDSPRSRKRKFKHFAPRRRRRCISRFATYQCTHNNTLLCPTIAEPTVNKYKYTRIRRVYTLASVSFALPSSLGRYTTCATRDIRWKTERIAARILYYTKRSFASPLSADSKRRERIRRREKTRR